MSEKIFKKTINKEDFYPVYLKTLNGQLALTNRELEVLVELCKLQAQYMNKEYSDEQLSKLVFSSSNRKSISTQLSISPYNFNNIIKTLKAKYVILPTDSKGYKINKSLFVPDSEEDYSITFKLKIQHDNR